MQHVIFARDRRKKKNRLKGLIFLMALFSIFIGIVLTIKNQTPNAPQSTIPLAVKTENDQPSESSVVVAESDAPKSAPVNTEPASSDAKDPLVALDHGEPTYIDIEINEADNEDEHSAVQEDANATSYEDDLTEQDDEVDVADAPQGDEIIEEAVEPATQGTEKLSAEAESALDDFLDVADQAIRIKKQFSYTVTRGDKLKDVLEQSGLGAATAKALERRFPQLANLQAGQQFYWILDNDGELEYLNWLVSEKEEKILERKAKNQFAVKTIEKQGVWKQDVVKGTLNGNFNASLKAVGLSQRQISQLASGLQWQIATNKLKKGDKFAILVKREYINGKVTDLGNVEAIHIISGNKSYYAIQADNGRYYSRHGETLGKGFARYPLPFTPRVSSSFNPRRLHPVTRRVAPHKGVDFAVPTGTLVIAPADGVVEHVAYQANGAGRYIKIRHGGQYTTVYMHLSKSLVRIGQSVKKGDRIALSGNTGRSTGAHLHYEFHINGNPVNPMSVKLPGSGSGMQGNERKAFLAKAKNIETKLKL